MHMLIMGNNTYVPNINVTMAATNTKDNRRIMLKKEFDFETL